MRRALSLATVLAALLILTASLSSAITYGEPDGNAHPNVGALIAEWRDPGVKEQLCSGTLIDEDVFLTAAHCTDFLESEGISEVWVSFDKDVDPITKKTKLIPGEYVTNPGYSQKQADPGDLAVVLLSRRLGATPGVLPKVGLFDEMKAAGTLPGSRFTAVGYGVHEPERGGGPPRFPFDGERWRSVSTFDALNGAWLRLKQNDATGSGGTCFGDSGGPNFLGAGATETNVIASITVTGDAMCLATNTTYRLDTAAAHGFVDPFLD
jgi:secreted trypsin-like serine protease